MDNANLSEPRTHSSDWLFWLKWVSASLAAILLGAGLIFVFIFIANAIVPGLNEDRFAGWIMVPILATLLGVLQWLVLRERIPESAWWILGTSAGLLIGIALVSGASQSIQHHTSQPWIWESQPGILLFYLIVGLSLGLAQIPILRPHGQTFALWLLVSVVGWLFLGLIVGVSIDRTTDILALGTVPAIFTGLGLLWLTGKHVASE